MRKTLGIGAALFALAVALVFTGKTTQAFHSGGVAECSGCHSMHAPKALGSSLLVGSDQSSTCLTCHEHAGDTGPSSYHISTAPGDMTTTPLQRTPGGDFAWLKKNYTFTGENGVANGTIENGAKHGHNIVALDKGYVADPDNATAPGGTFASGNLACTSCHDPHGSYRRLAGNIIAKTGAPIMASGSYNGATNEPTATEAVGVYRLLAGNGYSKGGVTFAGVPAAKAPSTYNQSEATKQVRVAYGVATTNGQETWGAWCATCHGSMHSSGNYVHPIDTGMSSTIIANYNSYVKSGDMTGTSATAFTSLVPFAKNTGDYTVLAGLASNGSATSAGPSSSDQVTCLSCHRAHASGMIDMLRFDTDYEFMTKGGQYVGSDNPLITGSRAGVQARGRTNADWQASYYDRPATQFATYQRVLCNKCHAKD